ncbi:flagellar hook-length control protein FliK [Pseudorhizobium halotolerans]|uniref:Flagellar hook-length control protein FliK n=1 Tax=Pseudorhizobium halotolerans TaxID=1233081 RepID=A0ABM8PPS0_9HYPH|nr:flagellar hook-length control protein FliK [Pseudorhizobium halotolerans]CAD7041335.1 flagellar hook-length control protein FliK [Pseudorhizobium halotolerans]
MMLDALSKAATAEPAVKGSGRSGKAEDGEAGFSSTLTRLNGQKAGEGKAPARSEAEGETHGNSNLQGLPGEPDADAAVVNPAAKFLHVNRHGLDDHPIKRSSISQAGFGAKHADAVKNLAAKHGQSSNVVGRDATDEAEAADADEASPKGAASGTGDPQGTSDLLNILGGPAQAWSAHGASRETQAGGGRKSESEAMRRGEANSESLRRTAGPQGETLEMPTTELDSAVQPARSFRFSDAKGGGVAAELTRAANLSDTAAESKGKAASIENISIVESRRFLGLAPSSNSTSLLAAMTGDTGWSSAMHSRAVGTDTVGGGATGSAVQMLKLQMTPHDLGTVTATLRLIGEELHVHLTVETRAAYRQLSEDSKGMLDSLKAHGFSVDQVTINISSTADAEQQKGQQNAATGQQMAGSGERNGGAQNREQQRPGFDSEMNGRADGNELVTEKAASADPVGTRNGQLYL